MKSFKKNLYRFIILINVIFLLFSFQKTILYTRAQIYTDVSVIEAYNMINNSTIYPDLIVLDVRTSSEYNINHICNVISIPLADLTLRIDELEPYNDTEIIVYCQSGGRSASASQILTNQGYNKVFNMLGGISAWIAAGYEICPIEDGNSSPVINFSFNAFVTIFFGVNFILTFLIKKKLKKKKFKLRKNLFPFHSY